MNDLYLTNTRSIRSRTLSDMETAPLLPCGSGNFAPTAIRRYPIGQGSTYKKRKLSIGLWFMAVSMGGEKRKRGQMSDVRKDTQREGIEDERGGNARTKNSHSRPAGSAHYGSSFESIITMHSINRIQVEWHWAWSRCRDTGKTGQIPGSWLGSAMAVDALVVKTQK